MPIAAMDDVLILLFCMTRRKTSCCVFHISFGSCSTQPDWGNICRNSCCAIPATWPCSSKRTARELVVPWSRAMINFDAIDLIQYLIYENSQHSAQYRADHRYPCVSP